MVTPPDTCLLSALSSVDLMRTERPVLSPSESARVARNGRPPRTIWVPTARAGLAVAYIFMALTLSGPAPRDRSYQ